MYYRHLALTLLLTLAAPTLARAESNVVVEVKGLVCSFCASGLTRLFSKEKGVKKVDISLEQSTVRLVTHDAATPDDARIKAIVEDAGFEYVRVSR